jgi:pre-mRNA-splicing factor ISY1
MARNQEKAQSMLNRWLAVKQGQVSLSKTKRRPPPSEVVSLAEAEQFRASVLARIGSKIVAIQNPGLGEARIRDINDLINRLIQQKNAWEEQIMQLGGRDYSSSSKVDLGLDSALVVNVEGSAYYYFGAARNLPGVKELLESRTQETKQRKSRADLHQRVSLKYFGLLDQDDEELLKQEEMVEKQWIEQAWSEISPEFAQKLNELNFDADKVELKQKETKALELERKKAELLSKYSHLLNSS